VAHAASGTFYKAVKKLFHYKGHHLFSIINMSGQNQTEGYRKT
jgi:hypothetical protein